MLHYPLIVLTCNYRFVLFYTGILYSLSLSKRYRDKNKNSYSREFVASFFNVYIRPRDHRPATLLSSLRSPSTASSQRNWDFSSKRGPVTRVPRIKNANRFQVGDFFLATLKFVSYSLHFIFGVNDFYFLYSHSFRRNKRTTNECFMTRNAKWFINCSPIIFRFPIPWLYRFNFNYGPSIFSSVVSLYLRLKLIFLYKIPNSDYGSFFRDGLVNRSTRCEEN